MNKKTAIQISQSLKSACRFLDPKEDTQLIQDVELVCEQLLDPNFRIAVLAPFNSGKSTLLNALLGKSLMPTKIVRTTGAAIKIRYGKTPMTLIKLKSGEIIRSINTDILKEFGVLNKKGQQRNDVLSIEVFFPHPLLKNGIELLDLPGTNDRAEQDTLVRDQLLQVDLVIQILNAKQPFTWEERETLRQWLIERGITNVIFALNWMNQLDTEEDRREVYNEVCSIANNFKSNLPIGLKNLYRVDALPALKAKQKRNILHIHKSGIATFTATLQTIVFCQKQRITTTRLPRVIAAATQVKKTLEKKIQPIIVEIKTAEDKRNTIIQRGKQREKSLQEGFKSSVEALRNWLSLQTLKSAYQSSAAEELKKQQFANWQNNEFRSKIISYTNTINKWVNQACNEFNKNSPSSLSMSFPSEPAVSLPSRKDRNFGQWFGDAFNGGANRKKLDQEYEQNKWQAYNNAVQSYLSEFSVNALRSLNEYERKIEPLISFPIPPELPEVIKKRNDLKLLNDDIEELKKIEVTSIKIDKYRFNIFQKGILFLYFWKNWLFSIFAG